MSNRTLRALIVLLIGWTTFPLHTSLAQSQSTAARMQNVVRRFVQQTGTDVVGLGSWIRGGQYRDVLSVENAAKASDHDLRIVLPQNVTADEAAAQWSKSRQQLIRLINEEFKGDAKVVLGKTNLYPPSQLLSAVEDAEDATRLFVRHNQVPNLGYSKQVTADIPPKFTEGLYGDGAKAWTQAYEQNAGMRFYNVKGNVFTSGTQYLHTLEGQSKLTSTGAANTARQWVEHAAECIDSGDGKAVGKYLERIERDLNKSKALVGVGVDEAWQTEMRSLASQLKGNPASLTFVEGRVAQLLQRASVESAILARIEGSSKAQRAVLQALLGAIQGGDELGRKILELGAKIPVDKLIEAIAAAIAAKELGAALGEQDYGRAIAGLGLGLDPFVIGILAQITHQSLEAAKDAGASFVGNRQDCEDLMAGIFTGGAFEAEGRSYTQDQLFQRFKSEENIRSFVMARAKEAAARELGGKTEDVDNQIAQAKFDKCYPCIAGAWNARRGKLEAEYQSLLDEVANAPLILSYSPTPLKVDPKTSKATARVFVTEPKEVSSKMVRLKKIAIELTGEFPSLDYFYSWSTGAKATNRQEQTFYEYDAPGFYTVEVTRRLVSRIHGSKGSTSLRDSRTAVTQSIDVVVEGREADGIYEGTLEFDSIRLVDDKGASTSLDVTKIEPGQVKLQLAIQGEKVTLTLTGPKTDEGAPTVKLSGQFRAEKNEASLNTVDRYDFLRPGIKKLEMSATGHLTEADSVRGTWKLYIAAEVPSAKEGETENAFVHAAGKWQATLKSRPAPPKSSPSGSTPKPGKKK
ncbi:MAG: hypothetical protein JSS49_03955 [Planctomycetes bacterium]|nr:hypothetical protein [Planctomycetota bacterium]